MSHSDVVSVVVPCYNASTWIAGALGSVLSQDWPQLEVIVVDDGSTDQSADLVKDQFPSVRVIRQPNAGVAAARNTGIAAATGQWVAFIDADDWWLPGKLRAQMNLLSDRPDARMACTAWQGWPSEDAEPSPALLELLRQAKTWTGSTASGWIYPDLLTGCCVWTSTVLARTDFLRHLGGFDTGLKVGEDYDLWLRASRQTPILRVQRPMALYRLHPHSLTKQTPSRNYEAEVVGRALRQWGYASPDGRRAHAGEVARSLARTWHTYGSAHLREGHIRLALTGAIRSIGVYWRTPAGWKLTAKVLLRALARPAALSRSA